MDLTGPQIIPGEDGERLVPSVVSRRRDGARSWSAMPRARAADHASRAHGLLREAPDGPRRGRRADELKLFPFRIAEAQRVASSIWSWATKTFTPPEISAFILRQLKQNAEADLGEAVPRAVITVPAYFNDAQRQATKDAGRIAGLEVVRLVNEPTAAALAYGLDKRKEGVVAVYDLGGGTFDISILRLHDGIFEVLATNGDTHLGGDDIDNLLLRIALEDIAVRVGRGSVAATPRRCRRLRRAVIEAKERLSFVPLTNIELEYRGKSYQREITRELFEKLIADIVDRTLGPCRSCIKDAGVTVEQIDEVVLVGGSTRIPLVRQAVESAVPRQAAHRTEPRRGGRARRGGAGGHPVRARSRTSCCST